MKNIFAILLAATLVFSLAACTTTSGQPSAAASETKGNDIQTVGLCMPTKEQTIWSMQGTRLQQALEAAGYKVLIEYAEDDSAKQVMQIENMVTKGVDALIIAAVDCAALTDACEKARDAGIWIIADDRAITNTSAVDYYVTCDYNRLAEMQGQYIVDALDLDHTNGPFTMEIFSGSQDDTNSIIFFNGQMRILQKYIDAGKIIIKSGQQTASETAIQSWDSAKAQTRMDNLLSGFYADEHLDICLATSDCLTIGCISSLESMGYGTSDNPFPLMTGQDAELAAIKNIIAGKQSMTVFIDATLLAEKMVELLDALKAGQAYETSASYDNTVIKVPMVTYEPLLITKDNVDYVVDVGYYTHAEVYD